jgi:(p)ppGpp synthase/HD superfamily hydrolase
MHTYAQTNVQLLNQLQSEGYSRKERALVREAYEFGMRIFAGLYLPSGKPFLDHLVGTASILVSVHTPVEVAVAGLIHAAYLHGDFGSIRSGITDDKRNRVRRVIGDDAEEYIARYDRMLLTSQDISRLENTLDKLSQVDRYVVLMRLANELEHHLDLGGLYFAHSEKNQRGHQQYTKCRGPLLVALGQRLGFPNLASEMELAFTNVAEVECPLEPYIRCKPTVAYLIAPRSYRERFPVMCYRRLSEARRFGFEISRRAKRLCGKLFKSIHKVAQAWSGSGGV